MLAAVCDFAHHLWYYRMRDQVLWKVFEMRRQGFIGADKLQYWSWNILGGIMEKLNVLNARSRCEVEEG